MNPRVLLALVVAAIVATVVSCSVTLAQAPKSVWDGVYTEAQARRGAALFDANCGTCHGDGGSGGSMAPALVDAGFSANYDGLAVFDLFERNRTTMPVGQEGQFGRREMADITAFMLQANKFPAGAEELPTESASLKEIKYLALKPTHQDNTPGKEWVRRLERPDRLPGLKIDEVIRCLNLAPGDVVVDIGAGTGARSASGRSVRSCSMWG